MGGRRGLVAALAALALAAPAALAPAAQAKSRCDLARGPGGMNAEGPTDPFYLHGRTHLRAVMLFVQFPDARGTHDPSEIAARITPFVERWVREVSRGKASISVRIEPRWLDLPKSSADYGLHDGPHPGDVESVMRDAVIAAGGEAALRPGEGVWLGLAPGSNLGASYPYLARRGEGVRIGSREITHGMTLDGVDVSHVGWHDIAAHEFMHNFGLPDLYRYGVAWPNHEGDAGAWDPMSALTGHLLVWHKRKVGWLPSRQFRCLRRGERFRGALIASARNTTRGTKAVAYRVKRRVALVVEARRRIGLDMRWCDDAREGVLVYRVDNGRPSGDRPVMVLPASRGGLDDIYSPCGRRLLPQATFGTGRGQRRTFVDRRSGFRVRVRKRTGTGWVVDVTAGRAKKRR